MPDDRKPPAPVIRKPSIVAYRVALRDEARRQVAAKARLAALLHMLSGEAEC